MPFKQFVDRAVLKANDDVDRYWIQQSHVIKSTDETVTSSTTLQNDDHLALAMLTNSNYWFELFLIYQAGTAEDLSLHFTVPAGAAMYWTHGGLRGGATSSVDNISRTFLNEGGTGWIGGTAANAVVMGEGRVTTGGTAGNLQMQFAQNVSGATGTIVRAGSILILQRLTE